MTTFLPSMRLIFLRDLRRDSCSPCRIRKRRGTAQHFQLHHPCHYNMQSRVAIFREEKKKIPRNTEETEILIQSVKIPSVPRNGKCSDFCSEPWKIKKTQNCVPNHFAEDKKDRNSVPNNFAEEKNTQNFIISFRTIPRKRKTQKRKTLNHQSKKEKSFGTCDGVRMMLFLIYEMKMKPIKCLDRRKNVLFCLISINILIHTFLTESFLCVHKLVEVFFKPE